MMFVFELLCTALALQLVAPKAVEVSKRSSICYNKLGCFDTNVPFFSLQRPLNFLPESPHDVDVKFLLYTRENSGNPDRLRGDISSSLKTSNFKAGRPTKMITHGFIDTGSQPWLHYMKNEFLRNADFNVIIVDWGRGSLPPYTQATANTRIVGAIMAQLIMALKNQTGAKPEDFHLIGHSLGAHVVGYAGERIQYIGRITGLDPAEPYFQGTDIKVRLDPSDALFVDVIHTNGESIVKLGYGMKDPCGHVDYFPNGGMKQPGCKKGPLANIGLEGLTEGIRQYVACSHLRAYTIFTESINSKCPFQGYRCNSYDEFNAGKCMPCSGQGCGFMGFHADKVKPTGSQKHVKYYLNTGENGPFCRFHFQVRLTFSQHSGARSETGHLFLSLSGTGGQTGEFQLSEKLVQISPGKSYSFIVTSQVDLGQVTATSFRWEHSSHWYKPLDWNIFSLRSPTLFLNKADVVNGEESKTFHFCGHDLAVTSSTRKSLTQLC